MGREGQGPPKGVEPEEHASHLGLQVGGRPVHFGEGPAIRQLLRLVRSAARTHSTVLLNGPTGSGKEVIAQLLHIWSSRRTNPFAILDCSKLSETLFEDDFFGHVRGAFTGADQDRRGMVEEAGEGVLLLDEIGELDARMQLKLLRLLESRVFCRLGSNEVRPFRARIVAATHRDLKAMVQDGRFREDLYYRLNVIPIRVPSLAERREDIPQLAKVFLERVALENQRPAPSISEEALELLGRYDWPGNIRELAHACEMAFTLGESGSVRPEDLPPAIRAAMEQAQLSTPSGKPLKADILATLVRMRGNVAAAARSLGRSRAHLYRLMIEYGIEPRGGLSL